MLHVAPHCFFVYQFVRVNNTEHDQAPHWCPTVRRELIDGRRIPFTVLCTSLFRLTTQNTTKLRTDVPLCEGNSSMAGGFPSQRVSNAESVSMAWHHHGFVIFVMNGIVIVITNYRCTNVTFSVIQYVSTMMFCSLSISLSNEQNFHYRFISLSIFTYYKWCMVFVINSKHNHRKGVFL